ncbi:MAG: TonB-dependent receptor [Candidatus Eisenbacteria bacterium]
MTTTAMRVHAAVAHVPSKRWRRALGMLLMLAALSLVTGTQAWAQEGTVVGKVLDADTGAPLAYTNVSIVGTTRGAIAREDGSFVLAGVPVGSYEVQASFMGYTTGKVSVEVQDKRTATIEIKLQPTTVGKTEEVVVTGERPLVDVEQGATVRSVTADDIKELVVRPTLDSVVEQQAGVTRDRDKIHVRGGRSDETLYVVDGVEMRDLLSGESSGGSAVSSRSVAEVNIITGGFDAQYGQALSGIIDAKLKEGDEVYHGYLGYTTDQFTDDWDVDLMEFQVSGPLPGLANVLKPLGGKGAGKITFFASVSADLSNGHLPTVDTQGGSLISSYQDRFFGKEFRYKNFFYPRGSNEWRGLFKSAWKASAHHKFSVSLTKSLQFGEGFNDTDIAQINRNVNNYPWAWSRRLNNYYTVTTDRNSFSFAWNQTLKQSLIHELTITRFFTSRHQDVRGQLWTDYNTRTDGDYYDNLGNVDPTPYFLDVGQPSAYRDRYIRTWALDWDWTHFWKTHDIRWGLHSQYEDVQYMSLDASTVDPVLLPLGREFDLFHVYPNTGALYLNDRINFEGLVASVGLRYDYWFPGEQVDALYERQDRPTITPAAAQEYYDATNSLFGYRFKGYLSPRVQVSHPINESSHLYFNYGHFTQRPAYFYVYAKSSSQSSEDFPNIGNPNLDPEISVQYELGVGHQFTADKAIKISVYNKDIYDYPTSIKLENANLFLYRNLDYARSRGIEIELKKKRTDYTSWGATYTFSVAKGKASDPNGLRLVQESGGDARETALEEEYMWWNRPHEFKAYGNFSVVDGDEGPSILGVRIPDDLRLNAYLLIRSGRAYTPQDIQGHPTGLGYSKNGPFDSTLNMTLTKGFRVGGRRLELTVQGWNVLNHRNATDIDPSTGERWKPGEGQLSIDPRDNPDNLELTDEALIEVTGDEIRVSNQDPRLAGLTPGTPEYREVYDQIYEENLVSTARSIRASIQGTINRYSDPSMIASPRHVRVGIGMEW